MPRQRGGQEVPKVGLNELYTFNPRTTGTRLAVEWISSNGIICDLDLFVLFYDERARFIEKLTFDNPVSVDGSSQLEADIDSHAQSSSHQENVHIDLSRVHPRTAAIVLFVDGGPRNFQFVQQIITHCTQENLECDGDNFMSKVEGTGGPSPKLFQTMNRTRKDFQGVALSILYKDGWNDDGSCKWLFKNVFEPLYVATSREKDERCGQLVVSAVPALDKYRPRLFPSVKAICSALSSTALPKLKKSFQKGNGLPIRQFTEVIFRQLYETHPRVIDEVESAYTVAILQDMFSQIDFNGDGAVDWDEFTTFCIHTGLVGAVGAGSGASDGGNALTADTLDNYVIEYGEDNEIKETTLNSYNSLAGMKYVPEQKRVVVLQDKAENVLMFNDRFGLEAVLDPTKVTNGGEMHEKPKVYDIVYIPWKDLYAYCASDHTIVIVREQCSLNGKRIHYTIFNKIFSSFLHVKLCWSEGCKLLCSVGADNIIYGWDLEGTLPIFHVSRHKDLVTDFIAIDRMDLFASCSLDKRIVLWSQSSRRVKGVLLGHKRGVRCMSYAKGVLLSAGFECEAKTWDIALKEPTLILKGHRMPVAAAKMMCAANQTDDNLRAVTCDDGGEFRLWNVFVKEKGSQCGFAQVLQVFNISTNEPQVARIRFLELPYDPLHSKGNYSNIIAASSKLIHLIPEKNAAEFVPPTCMCYSEPNACVVTGIGRNIFKYDISAGAFQASFNDVDSSDITCFCLDGEYGRRIYVGCNSGNILLLNFATGAVIDSIMAHSKEVSCMAVVKGTRGLLFSGSLDGRIRCMEENSGALTVHNTAESAIGDNCGIVIVKVAESLKLVVAASGGKYWGVWHMTSFKRLILIQEEVTISDIEILAASGDSVDIKERMALGQPLEQDHILTLAVCTGKGVRIYTIDTLDIKIAVTHCLINPTSMYISGMIMLHCPSSGSVNYSASQNSTRWGDLFVATTDEGHLITWNATHLRKDSAAAFRHLFPNTLGSSVSSRMMSRQTSTTNMTSKVDTNIKRDEFMEAFYKSGGVSSSISEVDESFCEKKRDEDDNEEGNIEDDSSDVCGSSSCLASSDAINFSETDSKNVTVIKTQQTSILSNEAQSADNEERDSRSGSPSVFSLTGRDSPSATPSQTPLYNNRKRRQEQFTKRISSVNVSIPTNNSEVLGEAVAICEKPMRSWRVHNDIIPCLIPLHEHGCIVTVSLDGYHRLWNMDKDCLGELPLPNITERMKKNAMNSSDAMGWKFILERIPVTKSHRDIAARLVKMITGGDTPRRDDNKGERRKGIQTGPIKGNVPHFTNPDRAPIVTNRTSTANARAVLRNKVLQELSEPKDAAEDMPFKTSNRLSGTDSSQGQRLGQFINSNRPPPVDMSVIHADDNSSTKQSSRLPLISPQSLCSDYSTKSLKSITSISSTDSLWINSSDIASTVSTAFSENSIQTGHHEGLLDAESHRILRRVNNDRDKVQVYSRAVPEVMLRNTRLSANLEMPSLGSVAEAEVSFGAQKEMYKNANRVYAEKKRFSNAQARHVVSLTRIKQNVRRIGSMVHVTGPPSHDISTLPPLRNGGDGSDDENEQGGGKIQYVPLSESRQSMRRQSNIGFLPAKKGIDKERIARMIQKITDAEASSVPDWELQQADKPVKKRAAVGTIRRMNTQAKTALGLLEKKLTAAIRSTYSHTIDITAEKKILNNRVLLPFYKMKDVKHFLEIFQKVDEDYSGDLDPDEWCKFFTSLNKSVTQQQARAIFMRVDQSGDGFLSIKDLIPVVFGNARSEVQRLILKYVEAEISKRKVIGKDFLKESDLELIFEYYDENDVGFVAVGYLRDKIKGLQLPEAANYSILDSIKMMEDDEMVNVSEFVRIFKAYLL